MSIILDPNKSLVNIELYYVEDKKKHGNSVFHFIRSKEEMEDWRKKGYRTEQEMKTSSTEPVKESAAAMPGSVVKSFDPNKVINRVETSWKRITWADQNSLLSASMTNVARPDGQMSVELDGIKYRDKKLKTCLKRWDIKDENGQPVQVDDNVIDMLAPEVAQELLSSFERVTEPTEEDSKN